MLTAILAGFIGAFFAPFISRLAKHRAGWWISLIPLCLCIYFAGFVQTLAREGPLAFSHAWVPGLNVRLSFYLDGLSLLFALIISFIGALVFIYSGHYFAGHKQANRFYFHMLVFMSAMLGTVLSDNVITMFVFWELTGISSYFLIGFEHEKEAARKAAWAALLVTGAGGLALLAGLLLLGHAGGSYEFSELLSKAGLLKTHSYYPAIFLLIVAGAFSKSAQFPFHFWLPDAMAAPTPVSTYLHSATMVKAGVYLLARMSPILGDTHLWHSVIISGGGITMLLGAYFSIRQTDLKRILAYSTVSVLGTLIFLIGLGTRAAMEAAMTYIMIHALYKAALFLVAGIVDHETGSRNIERLRGLGRTMPITAVAALLAGLSMAGLPPLYGFIGKELLYSATLDAPLGASFFTVIALTTNAFLVVASGLVCVTPFMGPSDAAPEHIHDPPFTMYMGPFLLALLGILIGLMPNLFASVLVSPSVAAVMQQSIQVKMGLLHGLTLQLGLSAVTFCFGLAAYVWHKKFLGIVDMFAPFFRWGPSQGYQLAVKGMNVFARFQTRILQSGHLHLYVLIVVVTTVLLVGFTLQEHWRPALFSGWSNVYIYEWIVTFLIFTATVMVIIAQSRLIAILALGAVGYGVVLFFIMYGAPDLAMTQFATDTLTVILLVLVIYRLPRYVKYSNAWERIRDAVPALAAGGLITTITLMTLAGSRGSRLSSYFLENSQPLAKGRNIVNVILVDFRGMDTLGEVTVLAVAGIGVFSLLKLSLKKEK